jgi:hypothetical protein
LISADFAAVMRSVLLRFEDLGAFDGIRLKKAMAASALTLFYAVSVLDDNEVDNLFHDPAAFRDFLTRHPEIAFLSGLYTPGPQGLVPAAADRWLKAIEQMHAVSQAA